jgi:phenylacetate-CoA ligase
MPGELSESDRFPLLTPRGRQRLHAMRDHPHAPRWRLPVGDRLDGEGLARVRAYAVELATAPRGWRHGETPRWVTEFAAFCLERVPFYRSRGGNPGRFFDLPACDRRDLTREPWAFVPDGQPLDGLIVYYTSGTTAPPAPVLSHPVPCAMSLPLLCRVLERVGVHLDRGPDVTAGMAIACADRARTAPMVLSYLDDAGFARINLKAADWRDPDDRMRFIDAWQPQLFTGDPIDLGELSLLSLQTRPRALISAAQALMPGWRRRLESRFGCPVIDLYNLMESGPVAQRIGDVWEIVPHDLYVEVLNEDDSPCLAGERGELTLTCGRNPFLPLLRYRTGDFAALEYSGTLPVLVELEGRAPIIFRNAAGGVVSNLEVGRAFRDVPLAGYSLHQSADGSLLLRVKGDAAGRAAAEKVVSGLLGGRPLRVEELTEADSGKVPAHSSDMALPDFPAN